MISARIICAQIIGAQMMYEGVTAPPGRARGRSQRARRQERSKTNGAEVGLSEHLPRKTLELGTRAFPGDDAHYPWC